MPKVDLDKFYTKSDVAKKCLALIPDFATYKTIIEPSAGSGAFSGLIKDCLAFDIAPENKKIIKQDFLQLINIIGEERLFVGNPPFGERSILAKKFIRHCIKLNAETIAFILPDTFSKLSNQRLFPANWSLIVEESLGRDNFEITGETYHVPCSFYVWTKRESKINLRKKELPQPTKIKFLPRQAKDADFTINGNNGKIKNLNEITNPKSEHYIKVINQNEKEIMRQKLSKLKFDFKSSVNGGNAWISQQEILEAYFRSRIENIKNNKGVLSQKTLF